MEENIQFEKALEQLEKIVSDLESGELTLEEALKRYEDGVKLSRACTKKLTEAEKKIEVLTHALNSSVEVPGGGDTDLEAKTQKKKAKKSEKGSGSDTDSDFLL